MNKALRIVIATIVLLATVVLVAKPEYRWLLYNGENAKRYAVKLLARESTKPPDWAIDLVVIKENGLVVFSEHNANRVYAFSPDELPRKEGFTWSHIYGPWFVGMIKT